MNYPCLNINLKKIVGRDPRPSGDFIKNALIAGILPSGADVLMTLQALQTASIIYLKYIIFFQGIHSLGKN
jgi:phosphomannomutase